MASDAPVTDVPQVLEEVVEEKDAGQADEERQWQHTTEDPETLPQQHIYNVATCSNGGRMQRSRKAKRKDDSLLDFLCAAIVQHQLGV